MITKFVGEEYTALYSVAYSAMHIASLLMQALNRTWAPWMLDMLQYEEHERISRASKPYLFGFFSLVIMCLLFAPEIIYVLGGRSYLDAIYIMPPLFISTLFSFAYQMYLQTEFYEKKTNYIGIITIGAALVNVGLNFILIPKYGYIAAGYTTMLGYFLMFLSHYLYASYLGYGKIFDRKFIFLVLLLGVVLVGVTTLLYHLAIVRYVCIFVILIIACIVGVKNKTKITSIIQKLGRE